MKSILLIIVLITILSTCFFSCSKNDCSSCVLLIQDNNGTTLYQYNLDSIKKYKPNTYISSSLWCKTLDELDGQSLVDDNTGTTLGTAVKSCP